MSIVSRTDDLDKVIRGAGGDGFNAPIGPQAEPAVRTPPTPAGGAPLTHNLGELRRFLDNIILPGEPYAYQVCAIGAARFRDRQNYIFRGDGGSTHFGVFSSAQSIVDTIGTVKGVSAYINPNPLPLDMLALSNNKFKLAERGGIAQDKHVSRRRWAYLDFDAIKAIDSVSATDEERSIALGKRDKFLADHPELARLAIWGSSGNGGWILIRLPDYPNDDQHHAIIARLVDYAAAYYGADEKTKNACRLMPLIGTPKCKGDHIQSRPWRYVTMESPSLTEVGFRSTLHTRGQR